MNERELDRAIDVATQGMMAREPGRALSFNVMSRVREEAAPAPWGFAWIAATASFVLCAAIAIALTSRVPSVALSLPASPPLAVAQPPVVPAFHLALIAEDTPPRRIARSAAQRRAVPAPLPPTDVSAIEPIETQPIAMTAIDVPLLEPETTVIDRITIEPLTIEPLSASND